MKPNIVTGIKPSGKLHVGNYLGTVENAVALQDSNKYDCYFFIADYHSITQNYSPKEKRKEIFNVIIDFIAAGLDIKKSTIFIQSHVQAHTNLSWILGTVTSTGRLSNMIEYKEKLQEGHTPNLGLFSYPVLMAADILIYNAVYVPVGEDQRQHVELARDIARTFNNTFGKTFKEPKALYTKIPRVMSLDNPFKKMSKSLPNGCLYLSDTPQVIRDKIKRAVTDSERTIEYNPEKRPGVSNLVLIYSELSDVPIKKVVSEFKNAGYAPFKESLTKIVIEKFKPFREKRQEIIKNKEAVMKALARNARTAEKHANVTLQKIHKKIGLI
ncbi:MAG: tryptophan--tRNA ligase [bacterium]